jgi:hypothetical protein
MNWRPIDTAPKGFNTPLLVCGPRWGHPCICVWNDHFEEWEDNGARVEPQPTHWMPLPEPPK